MWSTSTLFQKALIFLLIFWNSSTFVFGNSPYQLEILPGCRAVIPCQHKQSDADSFKWFYKKDEHSRRIQIFFQDKQGRPHHPAFHPKKSVVHDRSLVISYFTEEDQGLYWCETCYQGNCNTEQPTVIRVKEILDEIQQTIYVAEGSSFEYECPGELTNSKWSFEASNTTARKISAVKMKTQNLLTSNQSINIANVEGANAGKYTCWTSGCGGHEHKLLTLNLCVVTVHPSGDSSVSCAVICDLDFSPIKSNITFDEETGTTTVSVRVDPYGSLNCSAKQIHDVYGKVNGTRQPPNASNTTTGSESKYLTPVTYGTPAALACLILLALLVFCFRKRLLAAFLNHSSSCGNDDRLEEEPSVVYSSVVIRRPAKTPNNHNDCVYSEINV